MKLKWRPMQAVLPGVQQWGALDGVVSYVITLDRACKPGPQLNRFAVSAQMTGAKTDDLGIWDTLEQAKAAAELSRQGKGP